MPRPTANHRCLPGFSRTLWKTMPSRLRGVLHARPSVAATLLRCRRHDWSTGHSHTDRSTGKRRQICCWCLAVLRDIPEFRCDTCRKEMFINPITGVPTSRFNNCAACRKQGPLVRKHARTRTSHPQPLVRTRGYAQLPAQSMLAASRPLVRTRGHAVQLPAHEESSFAHAHVHPERAATIVANEEPSFAANKESSIVANKESSFAHESVQLQHRIAQLEEELGQARAERLEMWFQLCGAGPSSQ